MTTTTAHVSGGVGVGGTAPVGFVHGTGKADSNIVLEWDLDGDGDFDQPEEDRSADLQSLETVTGRDLNRADSHAEAGSLRASLLNLDDAYSRFNEASPLNTAPFSLKPGRKIRVRTAESTPDDPVLLARARFQRPDGPLGTTETGQAWTNQQGAFNVKDHVAAPDDTFSTYIFSTIDVGATDYYVQATVRWVHPSTDTRRVGLVVRFTDLNNLLFVYYSANARNVLIRQWNGGVNTLLGVAYDLEAWEGMTIGAGIAGSTVTAYVGGVPVASATTAISASSKVGIGAYHDQYSGRPPEIGDFHVWDHTEMMTDGILWTGALDIATPDAAVGALKTATLDADGPLAAAARTQVTSPRLPIAGAPTGLVLGDVLQRAGMLHPPAMIGAGTITTGRIGIEDGDALALTRLLEETERGHMHETLEGGVGYHDAAERAMATPQAWFSDTDAGQFEYEQIQLLDQRSRVANQVTAAVTPDAPGGITTSIVTGSGAVTITLPAVNDHDLLIIPIACTTNTAGERWLNPLFWLSHRDAGTDVGMRVYSRWCNGTEGGTNVTFYANGGGAPGLWAAAIIRVEDWFQSPEGLAMGDPVFGIDPRPLVHGWGRDPTLFIAITTAIASPTHMSWDANSDPPDGYGHAQGTITGSGSGATEAGIAFATKIDCTESEDPGPFVGLDGGFVTESVVFAVRGYNGPHATATLDNPTLAGGTGRLVTVNDVASQDGHGAILPYPSPSDLLDTEAAAEAYGEAILAELADDRPLVSMTFLATLSSAYREQAILRRVGDMIHLTATADTGMGIDANFYIEQISHRWDEAGILWRVTWLLSPA